MNNPALIEVSPGVWRYGQFTIMKVPARSSGRRLNLACYEVCLGENRQYFGNFRALAEACDYINSLYGLQKEEPETSRAFIAAANAVLYMYAKRQSLRNAPANSPAEINCGYNQLFSLADVAAYAGARESELIRAAAEYWKRSEVAPDFFN
ncbi:TPA: hypothetical protein NPQ19_002213 [Klebsiella pneumoniae]|uniref:hypothetical protein n=1 Tax=Klebsiella pneumoniae TaxID=573 RepID=UPI0038549645|nr:hypothetical protein [Klebsiella pneumoniae]